MNNCSRAYDVEWAPRQILQSAGMRDSDASGIGKPGVNEGRNIWTIRPMSTHQ